LGMARRDNAWSTCACFTLAAVLFDLLRRGKEVGTVDICSSLMSAALAQTFAAAGRRSQAAEILDELTRLAKEKYIAPYFFAGIHAGLGENDRAIQYLEKSYEEHSHWLIYLHMDPSMDGCGPTNVFRTCCSASAFPYSPRSLPEGGVGPAAKVRRTSQLPVSPAGKVAPSTRQYRGGCPAQR
jgi:hypothetical protein